MIIVLAMLLQSCKHYENKELLQNILVGPTVSTY